MIEITDILDVEKHIDGMEAVIFDLDDTLYGEKEYVRSGYKAIAKLLPEVDDAAGKLWNFFQEGKPAIDELISSENLSPAIKQNLLNEYRYHRPDIHLYTGVEQLLERLKQSCKLGIITDGRPEGQRAKIESLNLSNYFQEIIITDELGGTEYRKPNETAFIGMAEKISVEHNRMCYIDDNINKNFIAPQKLGMRAIWFKNADGLYKR